MRKKEQTKDRSHTGRAPIVCGVVLLVVLVLVCIPVTVPRAFGYQVYAAVADNVGPEIAEGSLAYVSETAAGDLVHDDIVAFYSAVSGGVVMQTVVENYVDGRELLAVSSDGSGEVTMTVEYSQVLGRVDIIIPQLGRLMVMVSTNLGVAVLAAIGVAGLLLIVLGEYLRHRQEARAEDMAVEGDETAGAIDGMHTENGAM